MALVVFLDGGICKTYHICRIMVFARQSMALVVFYDRGRYLQAHGSASRACISTLEGPAFRLISKNLNSTDSQIPDTKTKLWNLDNDANEEWSPETYRALTTQKSIEGFRKWWDRYPPSISFKRSRDKFEPIFGDLA